MERPGCASTCRVKNCCTNRLSSAQHMTWASRSNRERSTTPHSWVLGGRWSGCSCGGDTSKLLVYSESRAGRDVPKASCGRAMLVCSKVTTQLERSEKLRNIGLDWARDGSAGVALDSSPSYWAGKSEYAPSNVMTFVKSAKALYISHSRSWSVRSRATHRLGGFELCQASRTNRVGQPGAQSCL